MSAIDKEIEVKVNEAAPLIKCDRHDTHVKSVSPTFVEVKTPKGTMEKLPF